MWAFIEKMLTGDMTTAEAAFLARVFWRALLVFHIAWACGFLGFAGLSGFAVASDYAALTRQIDEVELRVNRAEERQTRRDMESELRRLEQDIFGLETKIKELQQLGRRVDAIYETRLHELRVDRDALSRRLDRFLQSNPSLTREPP